MGQAWCWEVENIVVSDTDENPYFLEANIKAS